MIVALCEPHSHRGLSPEPLRSLIDNSPLVDPFSTYWDPSLPLTPTDSMGNSKAKKKYCKNSLVEQASRHGSVWGSCVAVDCLSRGRGYATWTDIVPESNSTHKSVVFV